MPELPVAPPGRTIAIGDVHGCAAALGALVEMLQPLADDVLIMLGDVVDRGPDSRDCVQMLLELQSRCRLVCILGNHEQMMLDAIDGEMPVQEWLRHGGSEALDSYGRGAGVSGIDPVHVDFLRTWGDVYETPSHFFCHGNFNSRMPLDHQFWPELRWQSLAWHTPRPHVSGKTAVVGHTSNKQGQIVNLGHIVCIDTYCHGGGWLTALEPETGRVWQTSEAGDSREGMLPAPRRR